MKTQIFQVEKHTNTYWVSYNKIDKQADPLEDLGEIDTLIF